MEEKRTPRLDSERDEYQRQDDAEVIKKSEKISRKKSVIQACREIVADKGYSRFRGIMVDSFSASAILAVYDALGDEQKKKYEAMNDIKKMATVAFKLINGQNKK